MNLKDLNVKDLKSLKKDTLLDIISLKDTVESSRQKIVENELYIVEIDKELQDRIKRFEE